MPKTNVVFYREEDGSVPILDWLDSLQERALGKCTVRIERLAELGDRRGIIMATKRKQTSDAVVILHRRYYEGKPNRVAQLEEERAGDEIARSIHNLRENAGLTQKRLAQLVGTTPSVISRLEDSTYQGHSLTMIKRIAAVVNKRVEIRFVPRKGEPHAA
jgi:DNA-binding XRE family transcriptional regulator